MGVRGWAFFEMGDRSAARNQYCWIASITPRKYNKAFQPLSVPLPRVAPHTGQSWPREIMVGALGTRRSGWRGRDGRAPTPLRPRLALPHRSRSLSIFLFACLSVCLTIPHHVAARADLPGTREADSVSFSSSRRALGSLSLGAVAHIVGSPRTSVTIPEHLSVAVCGPIHFFS